MNEIPAFETPEGGRPYQHIDLDNLAAMVSADGYTFNAPEQPVPVPDSDFRERLVSIPGRVSETTVAAGGLLRVFSARGRMEHAAQKRDRIQHRLNVTRILGETISNPKAAPKKAPEGPDIAGSILSTFTPSEKMGWVGTHKRTIEGGTRPNIYRPATSAERSASRRLERKYVKGTRAANEARWLKKSYDLPATHGQHRLSSKEGRHLGRVERKAERLQRTSDRAARKFNRITASNDVRGRVAQFRLRRADAKVARMQARRTP